MLLGMDMCWLEAECSRYEFFADIVAQTHPEIGVVGIDSDPTKALQLVHGSAKHRPSAAFWWSAVSTDGQLILKAMRAGAKEFLTQPVGIEELVLALERIERIGAVRARRDKLAAAAR